MATSAPLEALLNMQPITLDTSASSLAIDAPLEGLATDTTQIGSNFDDLLVGGSGARHAADADGRCPQSACACAGKVTSQATS